MVTGINHLTWNVTDVDESFDFYVNVLGFKPIMKCSWSAYFTAGITWIALVKGPRREDDRYDHIAFATSKDDYESLVSKLKRRGTREWKDNASEGESFYFLDPSGNKLELHYSDLKARVRSGKAEWGDDVVWYV